MNFLHPSDLETLEGIVPLFSLVDSGWVSWLDRGQL
jgi:hypothetical protein